MVRSEERFVMKDLWRKAEGIGGVWKVKQSWDRVRDVPDTTFAVM